MRATYPYHHILLGLIALTISGEEYKSHTHRKQWINIWFCTYAKFRNRLFFFCSEELLAPSPNPQAGKPPLVSCPWLLFRYICCCPLHAQLQLRHALINHLVSCRHAAGLPGTSRPSVAVLCSKSLPPSYRFLAHTISRSTRDSFWNGRKCLRHQVKGRKILVNIAHILVRLG
jgi:hypothetical protein